MVFDIDAGVRHQRRRTQTMITVVTRGWPLTYVVWLRTEGCTMFVVAPDWDFMATASAGRQRGQGTVRLWDLDSGDAVVNFQVSPSHC